MGTIAEKLEYLDGTREKILTETNRLGVGLTEQDKFRDYAKGLHDGYVDVLNNGIDTLYDNMEKVSGSGSDITLENTEVAPMKSEIEGNTTQDTTPTPDSPQPVNVVSGRQDINVWEKNLLGLLPNQSVEVNGVIISTTEEGYLKLNGTATANINKSYNWAVGSSTYTSQQYTYSITYVSGTLSNSFVINTRSGSTTTDISNQFNPSNLYTNTSGNSTTFTPSGSGYITGIQIIVSSGYVFNNFIVKLQIEKGSTATEYEAYKGQSYEINLGYNLFKTPYNASSTTKNGITFTILEDGSINVSGTATAKTSFALRNRDIRLDLQIGETYTVVATGLGAIDSTIWLDTYGASSSFLGKWALTSTTNHTTAVAQEKDLKPYITIAVENGATIDTNVKVWVYKGTYDSSIEYTPYKTPIEVCNINNYKDMIFRSEGKNLWDEEYVGIQNDLIYKAIYVGDGTFTLSTTMPKTISNFTNLFFLAGNVSTGASTQNNGVSYDTPRTQQSINGYITIAYRNSENLSPVDYITMLNKGSTPLPYEPYNSKGKWLLHKEIGKVVLDGSENWSSRAFPDNSYLSVKMTLQPKENGGLCNYFISDNRYDIVNEHMTISKQWNELCFAILKSRLDTQDTAGFKNWLSTHNTIVYYVLATPTYTEITDTELINQLEEFYNAKSNKDVTYISVTSEDLPAILNVVAIKKYE